MFQFKQFFVKQERSAMKVGTDGVLLGAWVNLPAEGKGTRRILDIGTGTGLIALMTAQRLADAGISAQIDAVEIDAESALDAEENFAASNWSENLKVYKTDIQTFESAAKYDLIITNPPYFVNSLLSPKENRNRARHTSGLPFEDLVYAACRLLKDDGRLALILPEKEMQEFHRATLNSLAFVRECRVKSFEGGETKRLMREYTFNNNGIAAEIEELIIEHRSSQKRLYTEEYRSLTSDFYLKF